MAQKPTVHTLETLKAKTIEEGDCWIWQGYVGNKVPQIFNFAVGKVVPVRRLIRDLEGKPVADTDYTRPRCMNHLCVCPEHIKVETKDQHIRHMAKRANTPSVKTIRIGKMATTRRLMHGKLSEEKCTEIRGSNESSKVLADRMGVHRSLISRVRSGKAWGQVGNPWAGLMG